MGKKDCSLYVIPSINPIMTFHSYIWPKRSRGSFRRISYMLISHIITFLYPWRGSTTCDFLTMILEYETYRSVTEKADLAQGLVRGELL